MIDFVAQVVTLLVILAVWNLIVFWEESQGMDRFNYIFPKFMLNLVLGLMFSALLLYVIDRNTKIDFIFTTDKIIEKSIDNP